MLIWEVLFWFRRREDRFEHSQILQCSSREKTATQTTPKSAIKRKYPLCPPQQLWEPLNPLQDPIVMFLLFSCLLGETETCWLTATRQTVQFLSTGTFKLLKILKNERLSSAPSIRQRRWMLLLYSYRWRGLMWSMPPQSFTAPSAAVSTAFVTACLRPSKNLSISIHGWIFSFSFNMRKCSSLTCKLFPELIFQAFISIWSWRFLRAITKAWAPKSFFFGCFWLNRSRTYCTRRYWRNILFWYSSSLRSCKEQNVHSVFLQELKYMQEFIGIMASSVTSRRSSSKLIPFTASSHSFSVSIKNTDRDIMHYLACWLYHYVTVATFVNLLFAYKKLGFNYYYFLSKSVFGNKVMVFFMLCPPPKTNLLTKKKKEQKKA